MDNKQFIKEYLIISEFIDWLERTYPVKIPNRRMMNLIISEYLESK